jgi:hypothetical protein
VIQQMRDAEYTTLAQDFTDAAGDSSKSHQLPALLRPEFVAPLWLTIGDPASRGVRGGA